ncbi:MAG: D-glycero-alpha-D-manno-heptose-1,7-bisphosphate 7-phosphatase [Actinomycetota bacterium]
MSSRPFVVVDRDGTINVEHPGGYVLEPDDFVLLPRSLEGLRRLRVLRVPIAVVTNQSPIGRGWIDAGRLEEIHARMRSLLPEIELAGVYVCPHAPEDGCACRKPGTELLLRAAADIGSDPSAGFLVGDKRSDIEAGRRAGMTTILVRTGYGERALRDGAEADHVVEDLRAAADLIATLLPAAAIDEAAR